MTKHQHSHEHGHEHEGMSFTEKNRSHWEYVHSVLHIIELTTISQFAASYTSEQWQRDVINDITSFILSNINWIGVDFIPPSSSFEKPKPSTQHSVRVLDYACGPGTVTAALGSYASEYVGMDLSENMVKAYNARFSPPDSSAEQLHAHAVVGNLIGEDHPANLSSASYHDFDLVVVGLGFHHFENLEHATARLIERLKPGGVFLIIDFVTHAKDPGQHPAKHTVAHLGFGEEEVHKIFSGAGLVDIDVVKSDKQVLMRGLSPRTPFMGRGRKPKEP